MKGNLLIERMLAYVPRARTRGHLFPRNPLHPTRRSREAREASPFSVLPFRSVSPPYFFCLLFHCARPSEGSYLQYVFIQGIRRQKRTSGIGRELRAGVSSEYGGSMWERTCTLKEKEGVDGTRSVIFAEVATPASLTSKVDRKIVSTAKRPWSLNEEGKKKSTEGEREKEERTDAKEERAKGIDFSSRLVLKDRTPRRSAKHSSKLDYHFPFVHYYELIVSHRTGVFSVKFFLGRYRDRRVTDTGDYWW